MRARASVCVCAVVAAGVAACMPGARRADVARPLDIRLGTFVPSIPGTLMGVDYIVELFSAEPLVAAAWDGRPVHRLADSSSESPDGRILTVQLRPNVLFHSGEPVTAQRVRELLLKRVAERRNMLTRQIADVRLDGADGLAIHLNEPRALRLADLAELPVADTARNDMRTGPFRVASVAPTAVLEPFRRYHQGTPSVDRIEIVRYPSQRAALTAMMRGEVNFLHEVNREAIDFVEEGGNIRAYRLLRPYYYPLGFNLRHPILGRREVRLALNQAIDRNEIVRNGMLNQGLPAEGPLWLYHWAYPPDRRPPTFNPDAARIRLDAAGLPVRPGTGNQMPARFRFVCLLPAGDPRFERIALVVQRQLFAIGVDMQIQPVPHAELGKRLPSGNFESFLYEMASGRTLSWLAAFWRSPATSEQPSLASGYTAADEAIDRMRFAATDEDVRIAVADVMRVMREDPPALFLAWPYEARAVERSICVPQEPERDIFGTLWLSRRTAECGEEPQ